VGVPVVVMPVRKRVVLMETKVSRKGGKGRSAQQGGEGREQQVDGAVAQAISGRSHSVPTMPAITSAITMKKPQGSMRDTMCACFQGSRPTRMRPPSSGGSGNRLNAHITRLTSTPARAISMKKRSSTPMPTSTTSSTPQPRPAQSWTPARPAPPTPCALGVAQVAKVDRHRLGIAEQEGARGGEVQQQRHQDGAHRVDVLDAG
jgi:hypothetical protein